jgi:hypothetical protein
MRSFCSISVIAIAATLALAGTVSADDTTVSREDFCFTSAGQAICVDSLYVEHATATPSGNQHYVLHGDITTTFTGPGTYQRTYTQKFHTSFLILNSATEHVDHYSNRVEISEGGITCNFRYQFQEVSGDVKVDLRLVECTPDS